MQPITIKNTNFPLVNLPKQTFVTEVLLLDPELSSFEVITENRTYTFIRTGTTPESFPLWYVLDGQPDLIGKEVGVLSLSQEGLSHKIINRGDSLAIYLDEGSTLSAKMWHTSKILNFSVLKY